jgi:hypothetical protein
MQITTITDFSFQIVDSQLISPPPPAVEKNRDRPIIRQLDIHVGLKLPGLYFDVQCAKRAHQTFIQRLRGRRRFGFVK